MVNAHAARAHSAPSSEPSHFGARRTLLVETVTASLAQARRPRGWRARQHHNGPRRGDEALLGVTETAAAAIRHKRHNEERNDNDGHGRRSDYEATESLEREKFPVIAFEARRGAHNDDDAKASGGEEGG